MAKSVGKHCQPTVNGFDEIIMEHAAACSICVTANL